MLLCVSSIFYISLVEYLQCVQKQFTQHLNAFVSQALRFVHIASLGAIFMACSFIANLSDLHTINLPPLGPKPIHNGREPGSKYKGLNMPATFCSQTLSRGISQRKPSCCSVSRLMFYDFSQHFPNFSASKYDEIKEVSLFSLSYLFIYFYYV